MTPTRRNNNRWIVHKFGGTSVANAERIRAVASLLQLDADDNKAVVVSAMAGVTDSLLQVITLASAHEDSYLQLWNELKLRHLEVVRELNCLSLSGLFESDFNDISEILRALYLSRSASEAIKELIAGYGELWSSQILNAYLNQLNADATWLDARQVLFCENNNANIAIDWTRSQKAIADWLARSETTIAVIPGFIASAADGTPTTLKRNGSDYSASIFGTLLDAKQIVIWTDVDGIMSADPRLVPEAVVLPEISYEEATELAFFGAKVIHPGTMRPAMEKNIPIWIRNTFNPSEPGTKIRGSARNGHVIKGFATVEDIALVNVQGTGMLGVPGVASRLFNALREVNVSVILISQASSEHSICFAVRKEHAALTRATLERAFFSELHHHEIQTIEIADECSIIAAVGDNMVHHPGVAGKFFSALGRARVNVRSIAQGSSERNISAVIDATDSRRALRAVHSAFYLSNQTISIGVVGAGLIGSAFIDQLCQQRQILKQQFKIDLRIRGILTSRRMLLHEGRSNLVSWRENLSNSGNPDLDKFIEHVQIDSVPHTAIVDCTASMEIPQNYVGWLQRGIHIITPNKQANTASLDFYRQLQASARMQNRHYFYETTVGAGLPIITTLRDLIQTGDRLLAIEGVLSGTLSYIFNSFDGAKPFSIIVREARELGYTEPDPRQDLCGFDVARKLVILAREIGMQIEVDDVEIESLVPEKLRDLSLAEFERRLPEFDEALHRRFLRAQEAGELLRYVAILNPDDGCGVSLRSFPRDHPFAGTHRSDNVVVFRTARYDKQPLIVQGPGAGPEVTAAGVFADLLRLASYVGGSL